MSHTPGVGPMNTMPGSRGLNTGYYGIGKDGVTRTEV